MSASTTTRQPSPERAVRLPYRPRGFNKRSRQRFERDRRGELVRHLGHEPSYPEWLIIGRIIAIEFELQKFDAKMLAGEELSGHLLRGRLAAETRLRLDLRELGLRPGSVDKGELPEAALDRHLRALTDRREGKAA